MALIAKPNTYSAGSTILSAEMNENFDTVYNLVNGNIENANIKSSAAIVDTKLAQITTAGKVSGAAITSLASVPSGAGYLPFANLPTVDEDDMSSDSAVLVPTQQSVKAYIDTVNTLAGGNVSILDYGTSFSSSTQRGNASGTLKIAYGRARNIAGSSTQAVTNLTFTSSTSYVAIASPFGSQSASTGTGTVDSQDSGSQFTLRNNHTDAVDDNGDCNWIAIGI